MLQRDKVKDFQEALPIYEYKQKISDVVSNHDYCVITGDTGSGKSTQLPQFMTDCPMIRQAIIQSQAKVEEYQQGKAAPIDRINVLITQPRRMAAVSMANRVSFERATTLGQQVGYTIRFDDKTSPKTSIRYMTDGIFVKQCINDPYLFRYQVVILDEAHERSLYTDVLFALVKKAVDHRKGTLKLVVTSATLNTKIFSTYYGGCPVIQMHGKLFPVEVKYFPIQMSAKVEESVKSAIRMHLHEGPGDILVFLTGSQECESATRLCEEKLEVLMNKGREVPGMIMYQLYGAMSNEDQARVFEKTPEGIRKIVFSTNIAETSLTIDNIGFVIDCGYVKQKNYNPKTNMDSLITVPISKVQAIQRKGRAGRTREGRCLRLYSEKFYEEMKDYSLPQILRVSLSNVILTLKSMRIKDVINFDYVESPDKQAIFKALSDLFLLSALDPDGLITDLGLEMSKFPLEPQYSKAVISSRLFDIDQKIISIVSMLSTEGVWKKVLRINQQQYEEYIQKMKNFLTKTGDHETLLQVYDAWMRCQNPEEFCTENFLNFRALRQADHIRVQLYEILEGVNMNRLHKFFKNDPNYIEYLEIKEQYKKIPGPYEKTLVRRVLCLSFYYNTARLTTSGEFYILNYPEGTAISMDSSCGLAIQGIDSPTLLFTELGGSSSKGLMRVVSLIDAKWISDYLPKTKEVDIFRLAGISLYKEKEVELKDDETHDEKLKRKHRQRQLKIKEAQQRYQARKIRKTN